MKKTTLFCIVSGLLLTLLSAESRAQSHFVRFSLSEALTGEYPPRENNDILRLCYSSNSVNFSLIVKPHLFADLRLMCSFAGNAI